MNKKLNQIIATEKEIVATATSERTKLHRESEKEERYNGFSKTYQPKDEDGEQFPPEKKKVQLDAEKVLRQYAGIETSLFDLEATKDYGNCEAKADVVVEGQLILQAAPVSLLLFLEKHIPIIKKFVQEIPVLDNADDWSKDENSGLYRTEVAVTQKPRKLEKYIVVVEPTKDHPAQIAKQTEDVVIGYWHNTKQSGALPAPRKQAILDRINTLSLALKESREQANAAQVEIKHIGATLFNYLLAP